MTRRIVAEALLVLLFAAIGGAFIGFLLTFIEPVAGFEAICRLRQTKTLAVHLFS